MAIIGKPSRSYANVDHNPDGLSAVGSAPFAARPHNRFKTYRPSRVETHLKRPALDDPNPNSSFSPLHPAFNISSRHRKGQELAGQQAELDHILQPGYKSPRPDQDAESASVVGPSLMSINRTAGGLAAKAKSKAAGLSIRHSASVGQFSTQTNGRAGGIYIDANGKMHDTEFDPFAGVSEVARRKSRRRSAFGADRQKDSDSESGSASGTDGGRDELEADRRRSEEVSSLHAARRKSMVSDRPSGGRASPSIRSSDDTLHTGTSSVFDRKSRASQGYYIPSPLSPTFGQPPHSAASIASRALPSTVEEDSPEKTTESTDEPLSPPKSTKIAPPPPPALSVTSEKPKKKKPAMSVSVHDKKITVTGFDAPPSARTNSSRPETPQDLLASPDNLQVPGSARSGLSRRSSDSTRSRPPKPPAPQPEDLYPMTPAQLKRHQDRERRSGRASALGGVTRSIASGYEPGLASSGRGRVLPEIEIVEDDDPRIVFPENGRTTRIQTSTEHDHVIRSPFGLATSVQASPGGPGSSSGRRLSASLSARSVPGAGGGVGGGGGGGGSKPPSTIIEEGQGGYLPSRWANGDHSLRLTEDEREKYRPREWGGKTGGLGGRPEEWRPTTKEQIKRNLKDVSTHARFSMFRATQKLWRKAEL